jgi:hypothetical protein
MMQFVTTVFLTDVPLFILTIIVLSSKLLHDYEF